jgi:hypothetical protein
MAAMNADQRRQLGINGRAYAYKEFDRGMLMDKLEALLREATGLYAKTKVKA